MVHIGYPNLAILPRASNEGIGTSEVTHCGVLAAMNETTIGLVHPHRLSIEPGYRGRTLDSFMDEFGAVFGEGSTGILLGGSKQSADLIALMRQLAEQKGIQIVAESTIDDLWRNVYLDAQGLLTVIEYQGIAKMPDREVRVNEQVRTYSLADLAAHTTQR